MQCTPEFVAEIMSPLNCGIQGSLNVNGISQPYLDIYIYTQKDLHWYCGFRFMYICFQYISYYLLFIFQHRKQYLKKKKVSALFFHPKEKMSEVTLKSSSGTTPPMSSTVMIQSDKT